MKATKLVVGDFLCDVSCSCRILKVTVDSIKEIDSIMDNSIVGIFLSEEFLIANGFVPVTLPSGKKLYEHINKDCSFIWDDGIELTVSWKSIKIKYVHEFQHLLRMFEFDELADNLKV